MGIVIGFLHKVFVRFGVPDSIVLDNATQFTSKEFKGFCKMFMVEHITIAYDHPRSNGQAEHCECLKKGPKKNPTVDPQRQHCNSFYKCISLYEIKMHP